MIILFNNVTTGDILTFAGSIIGGLFTMIGVILTIKFHKKERLEIEMPVIKVEEVTNQIEADQTIVYLAPTIIDNSDGIEFYAENEMKREIRQLEIEIIGNRVIKSFMINNTGYSIKSFDKRFNLLGPGEKVVINLEVIIHKDKISHFVDLIDMLHCRYSDYHGNLYLV